MPKERHVDTLLKKLVQTIEASLSATDAARDAVQEILKRGAETGIFFVGSGGDKPSAAHPDGFRLTDQDRDFLRSLSIRPDTRH